MKPFWKSKTIWTNLLMGALTLAEVLPPHWAALLTAAANLGLRFVTTEGISVS